MNIVLWIAASLLALAFVASGATRLVQPREEVIAGGFRWAEDFSRAQIKLIGAAEVLGAVGLTVRFAEGRIAEGWGVVDVFSQLQQLGAIRIGF